MYFKNYHIRQLTIDDLEAYFKLVDTNRTRLEQLFTGTVSKTQSFNDTKQFILEMLERVEKKTYFPYLIVDNSNNNLVGFIDLKNIDWNIPKSELGCYIDQNYANKGITSKALAIFCSHCFTHFNFNKLFLRTHESNAPMRHVAEKCGFEQEGILRNDYKTSSGEIIDVIYYGKTPD